MLRRTTLSALSYLSWQVIHISFYKFVYLIFSLIIFLLTLSFFL